MLLDAVVILYPDEYRFSVRLVLRHRRLQLDENILAAAHLREQRILQVGAMTDDVGCSPALLCLVADRQVQQFFAACPVLQANGLRFDGCIFQPLQHAEPVQKPCRIRRQLQSGADFCERRALFENPDLKSLVAQRQCQRKTGNPGTGNDDLFRIW